MSSSLADLTQMHFLRPLWLLALLLLPLLAWWWKAATRRDSPWRDAVDAHLLPHLLDGEASARRAGARWLGRWAGPLRWWRWPAPACASRNIRCGRRVRRW